jgi:hypothetical protein
MAHGGRLRGGGLVAALVAALGLRGTKEAKRGTDDKGGPAKRHGKDV